ncbi:MAG: hypothetical protein U1A23_04825 [Candidatus Sungbacteria bacterium]|nr:hypothetical protein [Candidatus Sungbacteria bacterium]
MDSREAAEVAQSYAQLAGVFEKAGQVYGEQGLSDVAGQFKDEMNRLIEMSGRRKEEMDAAREAEAREKAEGVRVFLRHLGEWLQDSVSAGGHDHLETIEGAVTRFMRLKPGDYQYPKGEIAHQVEKLLDPRESYLPPRQSRGTGTSIDVERTAYLTALDRVVLWKERAVNPRIAASTTFPAQIEVMGPGAWEQFEKEIQEAKEKVLASAP